MASSARAIPRRLGQLAAQSRISSSFRPRTQLSRSWACRKCAYGSATTVRKIFSGTPGANATSPEDVNWVPHSADAATSYASLDTFPRRHIGPDEKDTAEMLKALSPPVENLDAFIAQVIPADILSTPSMSTRDGMQGYSESELLRMANYHAGLNKCPRCYIGQGYYGTHTPAVIQRNVLENPAWYTSYTPYQPEISQGRLESLVNFQTMVADLTALPIANASLLDEGTAAAEAMTLSLNALSTSRANREGKTFVVSKTLYRQTVSVMRGRAEGFGIKLLELDLSTPESHAEIEALGEDLVGVMVQYPDTYGGVDNYEDLAALVHKQGALLSVGTDLLALTLLKPPGTWGADIAFGSAQRFGVPMGFGGPHAAFFAVNEKHKRKIPGRLVGLSKDRLGRKAYRLALQTREQHIRREKATSNVCTSQALLANMSAFYAIYHGPEGLKAIAERVVRGARVIQAAAETYGYSTLQSKASENGRVLFDTVIINLGVGEKEREKQNYFFHLARLNNIDARKVGRTSVGISIDETTTFHDLQTMIRLLRSVSLPKGTKNEKDESAKSKPPPMDLLQKLLAQESGPIAIPEPFKRTTSFLDHPVFNTHHSETELLRYIHHLQSKDLSLVHSMIPLGSCTMKLNGTTEMSLISLPQFSQPHPYTEHQNVIGYRKILRIFTTQLEAITGMNRASLQPNSGAQGEFAGLRAIQDYHNKNRSEGDKNQVEGKENQVEGEENQVEGEENQVEGEGNQVEGDKIQGEGDKIQGEGLKKRDICLIPVSAHGTNPASAAMAGMRVVPIKCDVKTGNLDLADLEAKCAQHADELAAIMVTYPSTYGVFEPEIRRACEIVHAHGGQVYMDGANMNAQIGLCSPGDIGADVCHLNLHKTFCIPHGGGGPGVGPICVKEHLVPHLPSDAHLKFDVGGHAVSSSRHGSASINLISWAYNTMMGAEGLRHATKITLLNANYLLSRLRPHYPILYTNEHGRCAHEFILDARPFKESAGVEVIDIAKRLQDYGFHSPTMSWPVAGTLMIEPTESESREELDRFVDALVSIREEIREIEEGRAPRDRNVLKLAPHPMADIVDGDGGEGAWDRPYSREKAAYPLPWLREKKFWPSVGRVDDAYGDLNLFCTCPPVEDTTGTTSSE